MATIATTKAIRGALVFHLKNDPPLTSLVPAARVFPQQVIASPTWPYVHLGATIGVPFQATCLDGRRLTLAVHTYARTTDTGSGESAADDIIDAIAATLDGAHLTVGANKMDVRWISNNTIRDSSEASAFHGICQVECTLAA